MTIHKDSLQFHWSQQIELYVRLVSQYSFLKLPEDLKLMRKFKK